MTRRPSPWSRTFRPRLSQLETRDVPATIVVNTLDDPQQFTSPGTTFAADGGRVSLREALVSVNNGQNLGDAIATGAYGQDDTITFDPALFAVSNVTMFFNPLNLLGGVGRSYQITRPVDVQGPGAGKLTVSGKDTNLIPGQRRVFDIAELATAVRLSGLIVADGQAQGDGAGVRNASAALTLDGMTFRSNTAQFTPGSPNNIPASGGAVFSDPLTTAFTKISFSTFDTNKSENGGLGTFGRGGAVLAANLELSAVTFRFNSADNGGAVWALGNNLVEGVTFESNAGTDGGAIFSAASNGGQTKVVNSTFVGNIATSQGGAAFLEAPLSGGQFTLSHSTVFQNQAEDGGGGLFNTATNSQFVATVVGSVVGENTATNAGGPNLDGLFTGTGGNVFGDVTGATFVGGQAGGPTGLASVGLSTNLSGNGTFFGPETLAPLPGSPVLGAGVSGPAIDQRGKARPSQGFVDSGAFQAQRPTGGTDSYTTQANTPLVVPADTGLLLNDAKQDVFGPLASALLTQPPVGQGFVEFVLADGSFKYVPAGGFSGPTSFTYTLSDGLTSVPVTVNITVQAASFPPTANPDGYSTPAGQTLTVPTAGVLTNDTLGSGPGPLSATNFSAVSPLNAGTLTPAADGSFVFVPAADFAGFATFTYTAFDGQFASQPAVVTLKVVPVAAADAYSTLAGQVLTVPAAQGLLVNDTPPAGLTATNFSQLSNPQAGLLTTAADGSLLFEPAAGFVGQVTFTYAATVGGGVDSPPATVTLTVNQPPTANPDSYTTPAGQQLTVAAAGVLANDTPGSGPGPLTAFSFGPVEPAAAGTLAPASDGSFVFTPAAGYVGPATFLYTASDGLSLSGSAAVTITVVAPPTANPDAFTTPAGQTLTIAPPGVLANDTPAAGMRAVNFSGLSPATAGTFAPAVDGGFVFTPAAGFAGVATFTYQADFTPLGGTASFTSPPATVSITVTPPAAPVVGPVPDFTVAPGAGGSQTATVTSPVALASFTAAGSNPAFTVAVAGTGPTYTVTVTAGPGAAAGSTTTVTLTATDTFGQVGSRSFVVAAAAPPLVFEPPGDQTIPASGRYSFPVRVTGGVGPISIGAQSDTLSVADSAFASGFGPDFVLSSSVSPAARIGNTARLTLTATDAAGRTATRVITLTVGGVTPSLDPPPDRVLPAPAGRTVRVSPAALLAGVSSPSGRQVRVTRVDSLAAGLPAVVIDPATGDYTFAVPADAATGRFEYAYAVTDDAPPFQEAVGRLTLDVTGGRVAEVVRFVAYGSGAGARAVVRVVRPGGAADLVFRPFEDSFTGGARVALADINLDGVDDIVVGAGAGGGPRITVYDGARSTTAVPVLVADFFAFEKSFRGGVHVAAADAVRAVGSGLVRTSLLVAGAGSTPDQPADPRVVAFAPGSLPPVGTLEEATDPTLSYYAYKQGFRGGVRVAAGDLRGTGVIDVVTIPGPSGGPDLKIWDTTTIGADGVPTGAQSLAGLGADLAGHRGGAFVAVSRGLLLVTPDGPTAFDGTVLAALAPRLPDAAGNAPNPLAAAANTRTRPRLVAFTATGLRAGTDFVGNPQVFDLGGVGFAGSVRVAAGTEPGGDGSVVLFGSGPDEAGLVRRVALAPGTTGGPFTVTAAAVAAGAASNPLAGLVADPAVSVYVGLAPLQFSRGGE